MVTKNISEPIEYAVSGLDVYQYRLYLTADLVNPIYEGKIYPFPQYKTTTKAAIIGLNDIMESYVKFDTSIFTTSFNTKTVKPTYFTLQVYNGTNWTTLTETYCIINAWTKIGDSTLRQAIFSSHRERLDTYIPLIHTAISPTYLNNQTFKIQYKCYLGATVISVGTFTVSDVDENDLIVLKTSLGGLTNDGAQYPVYGDRIKISVPIISASYNPSTEYPGTWYNLTDHSTEIERTPDTIYFENRYGMVEWVSGTISNKRNEKSTSVDYEKSYRTLNGTSYTGNQSSVGVTRNVVNTTDTYVIKTHLLTKAEHTYLRELYSSPNVWVYDSTNYKFYSVIVVDTTYDQHNFVNDKIKGRTITLQKTISNKRR